MSAQAEIPPSTTRVGPQAGRFFTFINTTVGLVVMLILGAASVVYCPLIKGSADRLEAIDRMLHGNFTTKYPAGGEIASFAPSMRPISTAQDEQFSLLSDSSHRGTSTVRYTEVKTDSGHCLGIVCHLTSACPAPFAGVFANFSNPLKIFDVSGFKGVEIECRWADGSAPGLEAYFCLCERQADGDAQYAWAQQKLALKPAASGFQRLQLPFGSFETPDWRHKQIPPDLTQVFRFIIKVQAAGGPLPAGTAEMDGTLEVQHLRFY